MDDEHVNELGLLSYNYDVDDDAVTGSIDDDTNDSKNSKKSRKMSNPFKKKESKSIDEANLIGNDNNNKSFHPSGQVSDDSKMSDCQRYLRGMFYWIPIRQLCLVGSLCFLIFPFIGSYKDRSLGIWLMAWYIQIFGILGLFMESPTWWLTKRVQLQVFFFARFLRRTSGRALFYFSVSMCCFAGVNESGVSATMFAGIYMLMVSLLMLVFSKLAAKQLHEMFSFMVHNTGNRSDNIDDFNEDADVQMKDMLINYYNHIDSERTGKIGSKELHHFASQSLKRKLSNSENYTIRLYLDASCNGHVTVEDWIKQFTKSKTVKLL